ncbi:ABC transporter substrate-binding protein [Oceanivirga miroungae]|uniref:Family 5 extracellular solute-binding protein n=1 Tax=Oceanivirga miroungae TaxID=1130046 RepID=A0A6I8M8A5_9FUSO|nr:ABC transporter substrate-binding protein [Oceanivirga miroungae]VWL85691.1 family 5 extracellular solute-binding protein [Oceanivirga miroungae]
MKNKMLKFGLSALLVVSVIACGPGKKRSEQSQDLSKSKFEMNYTSEKEAIKGGVYNVALVEDTPFKGILSPALYTDNTDWRIIENIAPSIFWSDEDYNVTNGGMSDIDFDVDNKVITIKFREGLKWEDGHALTVDDLIYTYKILADSEYTGVRYDEDLMNVVGLQDYHDKKADTIKGLEKVSDTVLKIHIKEASPNVYAGAGGLISYVVPKHLFEGIEISKLEQSDLVRIKPLSYGPYKLTQIVPGESVELVPNEYWYEESSRPMVDKKIIKILPTSSLISSIKVGEFDSYVNVGSSTYKEYKDFDNIATLGKPGLNFSYLGFNLGHWDNEKGINVTDKDKVMSDLELRKAMGYALNIQEVVEKFYNNLKLKANSPIPPAFKKYHPETPYYDYNVEKANEILDKAGYKDVDGDGIRENKDGKPLEIRLAMAGGSDIAEALSQKFIQDWKAVGLNITLATGRLLGSNFYDVIQSNEGFEVFLAGFGTGSSLDLAGFFAESARFNFARLVDKKNEQLMKETVSLEALRDPEYRLNKIKEWNKYYMENMIGLLPIWYSYDLYPVNKRVKQFSISDASVDLSRIKEAVTQKELLPASK